MKFIVTLPNLDDPNNGKLVQCKFLHLDPKLQLHQYRMRKQDYSFSKHLLNIKYIPGTVLNPGHKAGNALLPSWSLQSTGMTDFKQVINISGIL